MADNEVEAPIQNHRRRRTLVRGRRGRLLAALLAAAMAGVLALTFTIGSAGAQSGDSIGVTEQQQTNVGQVLARDHHDEVIWAHHDGEPRKHHEDCDHRRGKFGHRVAVNSVAELLGLEPEALRDRMVDGETLADIAAAQGVEVSDLVDAIVAAISEHAAEHGREIDTEALIEKVTAVVNDEHPERPEGKDGWKDRRGLHRWGGHIGSHSALSTT